MANTSELNSTLEATRRVPPAASTTTTAAAGAGTASNSMKAAGGHRDSRVDSGSVDLETPLELSPKSPLEVLDETLTSVMRTASAAASPIPPPRSRNQTAAQASAASSQ